MRAILLLALAPALLFSQVADKANERYRTSEGREGMLTTLSAPDRATRLKGEAIVKALTLKPGSTVADLGTGAGAMLPLLSAAVGAQGKVLAEDIFPDFLAQAKSRNATLSNVTYLLGTEKDPKLPAGSADVALAVDSYHHYDYPADMLAGIRRSLKPGGRFVIVDYYRREGAMAPNGNALEHIRLDLDDVIKEVTANGFKHVETIDHVTGKQYIAIFTPVR